MTITIANVDTTSDSFGGWITKTNQIADALTVKVVSTESNAAVGNAAITGTFSSAGLIANTIGGNSTLNVSTNAVFTGANVTFQANKINLGLAANVSITGANSTHRVLTANTTALIITQLTTNDISSFAITSPAAGQTLVYDGGVSKWINSDTVSVNVSNTANLIVTTSANLAAVTTANSSGVITSANIVAGAVYVTSALISNSTGSYPSSNSAGVELGTNNNRWNITANNIAFSGSLTGGSITSLTTINTTSFTIGTSINATSSGIFANGLPVQADRFVVGSYGTISGGLISNSTVVASGNSTVNAYVSGALVSAPVANVQIRSLFTGSGTAAFGANGEIRAINNITAYYSSDERLKENIFPIEHPLDKLTAITGVEFDWTDAYIKEHGGEDGYFIRKHDIGVIAQEVEEVLPEVVATRDDGYKAVKYEKIIALLIEAVKELKAEVDALKKG